MEHLRHRLGVGPLAAVLIESSLRLPGLIMLELLGRLHFGVVGIPKNHFQTKFHDEIQTWIAYLELGQFIKSRNFDVVLENILYGSVCLLGATFLLLPTQKLIGMYLHVVSILLLGAGYYLSYRYVESEQLKQDEVILDDFSKLERHGFHFLSQVMIATVVSCLLSVRNGLARATLTICAVPIVVRLCGFPVEKLHIVHNFSCCFLMLMVCFYALNTVPSILSLLRKAETKIKEVMTSSSPANRNNPNNRAENNNLLNLITTIWNWLKLPPLFALFWCVLCLTEIYVLRKKDQLLGLDNHNFRELFAHLLLIFSNCCVTPLSLLGFCAATFYFSYFVLTATKVFLKGIENPAYQNRDFWLILLDHDPDIARACYAESVTLLILSFETGLPYRKPEQKAFLLCVLLFIIISSLLQSIFDFLDPILLQLAASPIGDLTKHVRSLLISLILLILPLVTSIFIANLLPIDVWLMIIISSSVLISIQTLGSLIIYSLFMYDAYFKKNGPWEKLDDFVFYCRSLIRIMEFLVAFSVIITFGVYESFYGEWSWTNTSILVVHCYINVWQRLQSGWRTFLLRREAAKQLDVLPVASKFQLERLQDVCSICYQEMNEARITPCNHFFHGTCLKKWLYVQQRCPMCHWDLSFKVQNPNNPNQNLNNNNRHVNPDDEEGYSSDEHLSINEFDTVSEQSE